MNAILFDLDGTLVDSAPSILASLGSAFADCGLQPKAPLTSTLIGPPLRETLARLCGEADDSATLDRLTAAFKHHYDTAGYRETQPFAGIEAMLRTLAKAGVAQHIATNKRALPTGLILEHLGWSGLFDRVYALDTFDPPAPHKTALLARLLADAGLSAEECAYVGDRAEDAQAAQANGLRFFWAAWGFGAETEAGGAPGRVLDTPDAARLLGRR
jgi:phosphoglycolate phosphatase